MINYNTKIKTKVYNIVSSNIIILLFFLFWFAYSTYDVLINTIFISSYFLIVIAFIISIKYIIETDLKVSVSVYLMLFIVPLIFLLDLLYFSLPNIDPFIFSFYDLIGLKHSFEIYIFLPLLTIIIIKILGIYVYFKSRKGIFEMGKGDEIFYYLTHDLNPQKIASIGLMFSLSAFIEELIYRSLVLSVLIYYFNFNMLMGIMFGSILFVIVHTISLSDSGRMLSLMISSVIYFITLIFLGILYTWLFHLMTNLFVMVFYLQRKKNESKYEN